MRVETNWKLVRRNRTIAQYLFFFSFGVLVLGLFLTNQQVADPNNVDILLVGVLPAVIVVFAFITTLVSVRMTNLWLRQPRPENVLKEGLKGLSNKSVLYNYYHAPARHVLITPQGVFTITTRYQDGRFTVTGDKWRAVKTPVQRVLSIFRFDTFGNPTQDALRDAEHVRKLLEPIAPGIQVQPLIIFTDPRSVIMFEAPTVPVLRAEPKATPALKDYLRDFGKEKRQTLTQDQIHAFEEATLPTDRQ